MRYALSPFLSLSHEKVPTLDFQPTIEKWRIVFGITAGIYWFSALFFIIFGSGKTAKWAEVQKRPDWTVKEKAGEDESESVHKVHDNDSR